MLRLTKARRAVLVQAFPAAAHVAAGGLIFSQFVRDRPFSISLALVGFAAWFALIGLALVIETGEE
jgi:hypothetical protein